MEPMECLVIYVPTDAAQAVRQAIGGAGAGRLGNYSHCSFSLAGTGRFTPLPGANPAIGAVGTPEEVPETRIEAIYPRSRRNAVVGAALSAHPYETPAFMTFPVDASLPDGTVTFTHGYADNDGLRMYYEVHGPAVSGRPPLLLIPGGGSTIGTNFSELIPLLVGHCQVIAVEEEGHGHTQPTDRPLTAENSAGDILAVLDQLNVDTVDVLGFSAGGHTAVALALARPAVVRRLIAASTFASRDAVPDEFWDAMAKATLADMPDTYKDADRLLNPEPGHLERLFELDRRRILDFAGWSDDELGTITAPTLVVSADRDVVTAGYAARMAGAIPGSRLLIVPGGHGDYLGEQAASGGDLRTMHATVPFLLRFLGE